MKCPHCFHENRDENIYCVNCGKKIQDNSNVVCSKCGQLNIKGSVYCTQCGNELPTPKAQSSEQNCPSCGSLNPSENMYCINCGTKLKISKSNVDINEYYSALEIEKKANSSLTFGIIGAAISLVCFCIPIFAQLVGIGLGIFGLIFGVKALKGSDKTKPVLGIVFSVGAIVVSLFFLIIYLVSIASFASMSPEELEAYLEEFYKQYESAATIVKTRFMK